MNKQLTVLVACEESQAVCKAFRELGHIAWSCDLQECSGGHPEWHIKGDVLRILKGGCEFMTQDGSIHRAPDKWDIVIAHPPCTDIAVSGAAWFAKKQHDMRQQKAVVFFMHCIYANSDHIAVENPVCIMSSCFQKPTQIIQPYEYGHPVRKTTCLWLKGLPPLVSTELVEYELHVSHGKTGKTTYSGAAWYATDENGKILSWNDPRTAKERSKTFPGIAKAMAEQWSEYLCNGDKREKQLCLFEDEV